MKQKVLRIPDKIMDFSLKTKIVVFIYASVIILFVFLSVFLFILMEKISHQRLMEDNETILNVANLMIGSRQQYMIGVADYYASSADTKEMMSLSNAGLQITPPTEVRFRDTSIIILSTVYYNYAGQAIYYSARDNSRFPLNQSNGESFLSLVSGRATLVWEYIDLYSDDFMMEDHSPKLCLWRAVRDSNDLHVIGAVAVVIDSRALLGFEESTKNLRQNLVIIDPTAQQVYNRSDITLNDNDRSLLIEKSRGAASGYFITHLSYGKFRVSYQRLPPTDFMSFYLYPYSPFTFRMDLFSMYVLVGILLYIICLFPSILLVSRFVTKPLEILTQSIQRFAEGDMSANVRFKHNDEIGKLGNAFNAMVVDNERLRISEYELILKNKDAELALMQTQVNPHFLYNMINAIQWKALKNGNNEIADIAYSMAQVFRISLNRGKGIITVSQEKDLVSYYLSLQKYRLGKMIEYSIDFKENTLDCQIPKLIIQPLVENSILHGMGKDSTSSLFISVSSSLIDEERYLRFVVQDNGKGIPPDILCYLPDSIIPTLEDSDKGVQHGSNRFALKNIYDRLKLLYDDDFTFNINGEAGTIIELTVPVKLED